MVGRVLAADTVVADTVMPRPPELDRDVRFWVRVYTEVDTNSGFLHDQWNLGIVYQTLHFPPATAPRERERIVDEARNRIAASLRRIAAARDEPLSPEDQKIKDLWGPEVSPSHLLAAIDDLRFQLGQADRFRAGLIRSGAWEEHIAQTLANLGLPAELAVLPHVESSFDPAAYSKVGAAGLWQFMRSTGRRYMRIDASVDDRMDPFRATEAAAQLLAYNYRLLGTWPLALTAYNHGAAGMRHAVETLGTDDIVKILRHYNSRTFGFASRNFYVSFLAALEVDRNPEKYFGKIEKLHEAKFQEVAVPGYVSVSALERALRIDGDSLRALNPALLRSVWEGLRRIPRAYLLRLPLDSGKWTSETLAQRLKPGELYAGQPEPRRYRVQKGDTIARIAEEYGITAEKLARVNRVRTSARLRPGRTITIPEAQPGEVLVASRSTPSPSPALLGAPSAAPPAAMPASPSPSPAAATVAKNDATDLYVVDRNESISDIATKFHLSESELLQLNGIRNQDFIFEGQQLLVKPPAAMPPAASPPPSTAAVAMNPTPPSAAAAASAQTPAPPSATAGQPGGGTDIPGGAVSADVAQREVAEDAAAAAAAPAAENAQPVSAAQVEALSPSLGPAIGTPQNPDPTDYSISRDDTIRVAAAETLGHYAEWLDVTPTHLRQLNKMKNGRPVQIGRKIHLDFHRISREQFEERRRTYHQDLQATYFASHRIVGTEVYIARKGDTLWSMSKRYSQLPIWLVQQYNPDVDLSEVRAGTQVVMPRVQLVGSGEQ
jgi:membrane-bound lytic murein transglycosylase D